MARMCYTPASACIVIDKLDRQIETIADFRDKRVSLTEASRDLSTNCETVINIRSCSKCLHHT